MIRHPPPKPTLATLEIWDGGRPIDWATWVPAQRALGWPLRAVETLRLARIPAARLTINALLDAARKGELYG